MVGSSGQEKTLRPTYLVTGKAESTVPRAKDMAAKEIPRARTVSHSHVTAAGLRTTSKETALTRVAMAKVREMAVR